MLHACNSAESGIANVTAADSRRWVREQSKLIRGKDKDAGLVSVISIASYAREEQCNDADAHRDHNQRFVLRADGKLTIFVELESATRRATATTIG